MKKLLLVVLALIGMLDSCEVSYVDNNDDGDTIPTIIIFDNNNEANCSIVVYDDVRRREEDIITVIPANNSSWRIEWEPGEMVFYFSYRLTLRGINDFTVDYIPSEAGFGKDRTAIRVDANKTTRIPVPNIATVVPSGDTFLVNNSSYLVIQNRSFSSFRLESGSSLITPDNLSSPMVNPGEQANYKINPGLVSSYRLLVSPDYKPFPDIPDTFKAGYVYRFNYGSDGVVKFDFEVEIKLKNVTVSLDERRSISVDMWDSGGNGWGNAAALRINVNGADFPQYARLGSGSQGSFYFSPYAGDIVEFYWVNGGQTDNECAFVVYYARDKDQLSFDPKTGAKDSSKALLSKQYNNPSGAVGNGKLLGSFIVARPGN